jgi:DNA repair protein RadD
MGDGERNRLVLALAKPRAEVDQIGAAEGQSQGMHIALSLLTCERLYAQLTKQSIASNVVLHTPRDYQAALIHQVPQCWSAGAKNVLVVLPTGGGKTYVFAALAAAARMAVCAIAHRGELVSQMSVALGRESVRHRIVGAASVHRDCVARHMDEFGRSFIDDNARVVAAGVDTLIGMDRGDPWFSQVGLWITDEAHHLLTTNKWGRAVAMFPNARGLGVTATPVRADGKGLGRDADGVFDAMLVGPTMRELIERGFLTDYRVISKPSDIDLSAVTVTDSGDYSPPKLRAARRASHVTGDVVEHYLRFAKGKLGVTFDTDIDSATETAAAYRAVGVPAEVVTGKTPDLVRAAVQRRFRNREVHQLVNVDLFGEGYDLPAIEVVSMARPTMSFGLYCQQFGRALRTMQGKSHAIIIDHVGNVARHGLPDAKRRWSLDRRERGVRRGPSDVIPVRTCLNPECCAAYERIWPACPYCGHVPPISERSSPDRVDGDLIELDPSVLRALRGEINRIDGPVRFPAGATGGMMSRIQMTHAERQLAQKDLREEIALWAGWQRDDGRSDAESYRRFFFRYGVDVATACTLGAKEAKELTEYIRNDLAVNNIIAAP